MTPPGQLWFLVPGDLQTPTGGYGYDRRIIAGLRRLGWSVVLVTLDESFPEPTAAALADAGRRLAAIPDGSRLVVDGLAFGRLGEVAEAQARRLSLIALVHHPLALETGLEPSRVSLLRADETRALATTRRVIVTSQSTAERLVRDYGVPANRIRVVAPGTDPAPLAIGSGGPEPRLLCVAALTHRKGHDILLRALAELRDRPWHLDCIGSLERSSATTLALRDLTEQLGLSERVSFVGAVDEGRLAGYYERADLFVLATRFEGYGMVLTEALARGLPILSTRVGAVPTVVPAAAGLLVAPDDPGALREALARWLDDPRLRHSLAAGARSARARLRSWDAACADFARVNAEVCDV